MRKSRTSNWLDIGSKLALKIVKTKVGIPIARDAAVLMRRLEEELKITPWHLVAPLAPEAP